MRYVTMAAFLACVGGVGGQAYAQSFARLGPLPGGAHCEAACISADGSVVVGTSTWEECCQHAARWTRVGDVWQAQDLGLLPDGLFSAGEALNGDGSVAVGFVAWGDPSPISYRAFRWTAADGIALIDGQAPPVESICVGITSDGAMVCGWENDVASVWMLASGGESAVPLGVLDGDTFSTAWALSADGSVVVGNSSNQNGEHAFRWTESGGMEGLSRLPGGGLSSAIGVSSDGSVVVGWNAVEGWDSARAFAWRRETGMVELALLPGWTRSSAVAVSGDGSVVAGFCYADDASVATLWSERMGVVDLNEFLPRMGVDLSGWTLTGVYSVTADGRTLVGNGLHDGQDEGWIATIPGCGSDDFNCDGDAGTDADIEAFFACLGGACPLPPCRASADFNGDGDVGTDGDIEAFFRVIGGGAC